GGGRGGRGRGDRGGGRRAVAGGGGRRWGRGGGGGARRGGVVRAVAGVGGPVRTLPGGSPRGPGSGLPGVLVGGAGPGGGSHRRTAPVGHRSEVRRHYASSQGVRFAIPPPCRLTRARLASGHRQPAEVARGGR